MATETTDPKDSKDSTPASAPEASAPAAPAPAAPAPASNRPSGPGGSGGNRGPGGPGGNRGPGGQGGNRGPGGPGGNRGPGGGNRPPHNSRNPRGGGQDGPKGEDGAPEISEKVVFINRCAKVVKGGRRFSFSALVVTGDHKGKVGFGFGKAKEVAECIRKAGETAKEQMVKVPMVEATIPHEVIGVHGGGRVLLRPASPGTGIVAGGSVRSVLESAGYKDVLTKSLGSNNHANVVKATIAALTSLRTKDEIYALRGRKSAEKKAI